MKELGNFSICVLLFLSNCLYAQLMVENFSYSLGDLTSVSSNWSESPTGSTDIEVVSGNLSYTNYPSSGLGQMILVDGGATGRSGITRAFSEISGDGNAVYVSFLISLNDVIDLDVHSSSGEYFFELKNTAGTSMKAYLYIRSGSAADKYNIGIAKSSSSSLTWISLDLDISTTYLLVVAYKFNSGAGDDEVQLWLDPDISESEPSSDVSITSGTDASDIGLIQFRQEPLSGNVFVDGIRVSTEWSNAPLPVELVEFTGYRFKNCIRLDWTTVTEINNYGFEVEKYKAGVGQALSLSDLLAEKQVITTNIKGKWHKLAFIPGHGNSSSPKSYSFMDSHPIRGENKYRLKQIDCNGSFEYSGEVVVCIAPNKKLRMLGNYPNPFNPATNIHFILTENSRIELSLYDSIGRLIKVMDKNIYCAGQVNIQLDFTKIQPELPSGVYFLKVYCVGHMETMKLIYMK